MKILFDQGVPVPLREILAGHEVMTAYEMGWSTFTNGTLLQAAEDRFNLLITTDKRLRYQQNLSGRKLTILVLPTTSWPHIQRHTAEVVEAVSDIKPGAFLELSWRY